MAVDWGAYERRLTVNGSTPRERNRGATIESLTGHVPDSVSYRTLNICRPGTPGYLQQDLAVLNSDDYGAKALCALPGEEIVCGSIVFWKETHWLVTELDSDTDVYQRAKMLRCNYELKFSNSTGATVSKHSVIRDVTKYLVGENEKKIMTVGDSRMSVTVARDSDTDFIRRGTRFIIDSPGGASSVAYEVTKMDRVTGLVDGNGVYKFLVCEVNARDTDDTANLVPDNSEYEADPNPQTGGWF